MTRPNHTSLELGDDWWDLHDDPWSSERGGKVVIMRISAEEAEQLERVSSRTNIPPAGEARIALRMFLEYQ